MPLASPVAPVWRRGAEIGEQRALRGAQAGALAFHLRRSERLLVGQILGQTDDHPHLAPCGRSGDQRFGGTRAGRGGNDEKRCRRLLGRRLRLPSCRQRPSEQAGGENQAHDALASKHAVPLVVVCPSGIGGGA